MTKDEIMTADIETIEARSAELLGLEVSDETPTEEIEARADEMEAIEERKNILLAEAQAKAEERARIAEDDSLEPITTFQEERNMKDIKEFRNSEEYINAYAEMIKTGKDEELRSLLSENVEGGQIAVPDFVYDEVKTAWDNEEIMSLVSKTSIKGNLKVQFEISGTDAVIHTEGSGAVTEETLTEGIVTIVPAFVKKWISISDEVMALRGQAFLSYIYKELTHKIAKKMADQLIALIVALPETATATSVAAAKVNVAPSVGAIAEGVGNLSDEASAPVVVMNKLTWATFKAAQYAANYAVDPFEGLKVVFNNTLPAYSAAGTGDCYAIVGDFRQGAIANFPEGEGVIFTFDDKTLATSDLVRVIGKEYVGLGIVADKAFVKLCKTAG